MKRLCVMAAVALIGAAPAIGVACEYSDVSASASAAPTPVRTESTTASVTVKAPARDVAKAPAPPTDKAVVKAKTSVTGQKLAATAAN